ncbi:hypothetical protein RB595_004936 [Gaeumannomyces hyphopodioides]
MPTSIISSIMSYKYSVIVTGGTVGLGYNAARRIAKDRPDHLVVIASRSDDNKAADSINASLRQQNTAFMPLDLSSPSSVRSFAAAWSADAAKPPLKALVLNAALQFPGSALVLTPEPDRFETTFAVAHVGHALLFHLLAPRLDPAGARVVVVASGVHDPAQKSGLPDAVYTTADAVAHPADAGGDGRRHYANAKLCNVLWAYALARHLEERGLQRRVAVTAFDPGLMPGTGLAREYSAIERFVWNHVLPRILPVLRLVMFKNIHSPQESGDSLARLAVGADVEGVTGRYFEGRKEISSSKDSYVESKQEDLWEWTVNYAAGGDAVKMAQFRAFQ